MDSTLACLAAWMPRQRWYAAKGRPPSLRLISWWDLAPAAAQDEDARIRTYLVADEGALPVVLYQLPVVSRATETVDAPPDHIIGSPEPGTTFIDAPFDPAYARALIRMVTLGGRGEGPRTVATGHPAPDAPSDEPRSATVMTGEQSNTSLIYRSSGMPIICKVYRQLHPGLNPDIELPTALAAAGSVHVPRAIGWIEGSWPDPATAQGTVTGSLASAQEFLPDVEDAWRVALRAAARGQDFRGPARALGAATADVHVSLAELFPTRETLPADREATATSWRRRLTIAIAEVPDIAERREAIEVVYERAAAEPWPAHQRIHGDYHLGQVLHVPGRGWVLLDFEGEPLRPMVERTRADLALRDVAGMLRSFDYVAGSIRLDGPERSPGAARDWARAAREAFLEGYALASGVDLETESRLLAALELDKAVYEAIYEARNRPTWVTIPLQAIARLVERPAPVT
ncbi:maltokinase N-terminal cap-like domain-containing protein [Microbacterium sp. CFBP9034]|uniref:maltokinase N-terminal cap-like domain-containing protein n=1 Tax=Microbacterium sp. CFBP9034 TaxID=3096540 RepID=UPI002A6B7375|nr:phosphotransferase [Microbacterium sp. CFBP9034]MDY0909337.1 aminoglycoside phosphotransferase [Microbacterium sp. CFBP9034]